MPLGKKMSDLASSLIYINIYLCRMNSIELCISLTKACVPTINDALERFHYLHMNQVMSEFVKYEH